MHQVMNVVPHTNIVLTLLGDGGVGKTALLERIHSNKFIKRYLPTGGVERSWIQLEALVNGEKRMNITLLVEEHSGQEKFSTSNKIDPTTNVVVVMFDVCTELTFNNIERWLNKALRALGPNFHLIVCGNKVELQNARKVEAHEVQKFLDEYVKKNRTADILYVETSVRSLFNVVKLFELMVEDVLMLNEHSVKLINL